MQEIAIKIDFWVVLGGKEQLLPKIRKETHVNFISLNKYTDFLKNSMVFLFT